MGAELAHFVTNSQAVGAGQDIIHLTGEEGTLLYMGAEVAALCDASQALRASARVTPYHPRG